MNALIWMVDGLRALLLIGVAGGVAKAILVWRRFARTRAEQPAGTGRAPEPGPGSASPPGRDA